MTPQQKTFLLDLIHAAFDLALRQGIEPPIDLAPFGKLLRELEPGFSHQAYGHEKLLHLLRGEFYDWLQITKDQQVDPPRYGVSLLSGPRPQRKQKSVPVRPVRDVAASAIDPSLVDGALIECYLDSLAESWALTQRRFDEIDRRLLSVQDELARSRANETRMHQELRELDAAYKRVVNRSLGDIQRELEQSRENESRMNAELREINALLRKSGFVMR